MPRNPLFGLGSAFLHEVGGQVLVRVTVAVGADDGLAPQRPHHAVNRHDRSALASSGCIGCAPQWLPLSRCTMDAQRPKIDVVGPQQPDDSTQLCAWIDEAKHSACRTLVRFAYSLQRDVPGIAVAVDTS